MDEFSEKYKSLMEDLCMFVDEFFANIDNLFADDLYMSIIEHIVSIVYNLSDKPPLVPMLVDAHYAKNGIKWFEKLSFQKSTKDLHKLIMIIIQNLTRHKEGLQALREEHDAFKTLMKCKPLLDLEADYELGGMAQSFGMSIIALATSDDEQKENEELIRTVSYKLYQMCTKAAPFSNKLLRYGGYHLSELLNSLNDAFSNTAIIRFILGDKPPKPDRIKFFAELLVSLYGSLLNQEADYLEEIIGKSLLNILLYISNYEEYRVELCKHDQFCVLIEGLSKRSEQNITKRIWCNLNLIKNPEEPFPQLKVKKQPMIFISHNWSMKDMRVCISFVEELKKLTDLPIWVDFEELGYFEDSWDDIALAINQATVIIVLLSSAYCESPINFQELTYAVTLSEARTQSEKSSFIFLEIENDTAKKREWISKLISNLSKENEIISYDKDQHQMALKVVEQNTCLKNKRELIRHSTGTAAQSRVCTIM